MAKTNPADLFREQMKGARSSFMGGDQKVHTIQENKKESSQEPKESRTQEEQNSRTKETKKSRTQEIKTSVNQRKRRPKNQQASGEVKRSAANITLRDNYRVALITLAARKGVRMWQVLDEAIGSYLAKEKMTDGGNLY